MVQIGFLQNALLTGWTFLKSGSTMDIVANLKEQFELSTNINAIWDDCNPDGTLTSEQMIKICDMSQRLAELVVAVKNWNAGNNMDGIMVLPMLRNTD